MLHKLYNLFINLILNLSEMIACWEQQAEKDKAERKAFYEEKHCEIKELK